METPSSGLTEAAHSRPPIDGSVGAELRAATAAASTVAALGEAVVAWLEAQGLPLPSIFFEVAGRLRRVALRGYWQILEGFSLEQGVIADAFRTGQPQFVPDVQADPRYIAAIPEVVAELCLPIRYAGQVIGIMNVESTSGLSDADRRLVHLAATHFEERLAELGGPEHESPWQLLARRSGELAELDDPDTIGAFAVAAAAELLGFGSALLVIERRGELRVQAACGPFADALRTLPRAVLADLATWTSSATSAYTLGALRGHGYRGHETLLELGLRSLASASLQSNGGRHGYLLVVDPETIEIDVAAVQHLEVLATHTASALYTAFALEELRIRAEQDPLTGLGHAASFHAHLRDTLTVAERPVAVLLMDLDNFKHINDTAGHLVGDRVLCETARLLRLNLRRDDLLFRVGGDEFAAILVVQAADEAMDVAARIVEGARRRARTRLSIGVVVCPPGGEDDADTLYGHADLALYDAKRAGRNRVTLYRPELHTAAEEEAALQAQLPEALERGELFLEFQPVVDLGTAGVLGLEALVRWRHPELGLIPPSRFVPLAEVGDHIDRLGTFVLDEACRAFAAWQHGSVGRDDLKLGINVSAAELGPRLLERVTATLARHGIAPSRLVIEVTEGVFADEHHAAAPLRALRELGVNIAIDDFGTGYSSLSYLPRLPVNLIKLDRAFVGGLDQPATAAVARAIVDLGRTLELSVVAEGVETEAQRDRLLSFGCEHAQGFLWSPPVPADEVPATLCRLTRELGSAQRAAS